MNDDDMTVGERWRDSPEACDTMLNVGINRASNGRLHCFYVPMVFDPSVPDEDEEDDQ